MNIFAFLNSYSQGLSGGDACFLNNFKNQNNKEKLCIVTSSLGMSLCKNAGLIATYFITSREKKFSRIISTYVVRTIRALFLKVPPEKSVIYSSSDFIPDVLPAFFIKKYNSKHIWVQKIFHLIPKERLIPHIFQLLSFQLIKSSNIIIVDNSKLKEDLQNLHELSLVRIEVISPGVDIKSIKKIKQDNKVYDAIFIGQLRQSKGIFDIPKIWKNVTKKYHHAQLVIIGKNIGNNQSLLEKQILEEKLTHNVVVLGFQSTEKTFSLLKAAKCFILPSYEEGFGMVVLESLVCGTPVVTYNLPVFNEYFGNGIDSVEIGNINNFSNKVIDRIKINRREDHKEIYKKFDIGSLVKKEKLIIKNIYEKTATC